MHRSRLVLVLLALGSLAALACGTDSASGTRSESGTDDGRSTSTTSVGGSSTADAFPVTVEHRYGSTTIGAAPTRIVSLDTAWTDVLVAMGHPPVGHLTDAGVPDRFPWQGEGLDGSTEMPATTELPWEQIAALRPDLIVVGFAARDRGDVDELTQIAPTIALLGDSQVDRWQDLTTTAGTILGDPERAREVIADVDGEVADVAAELPGLRGRTFSFANYVPGDAIFVLSDPDDGADVLFGQLGMVIPDRIAADAADGRVELSLEQIGMLDGDLLLALLNGAEPSSVPGWAELPAVRSGAVVEMDAALATALNTPTPLSIPWALEQIRPQLEIAAG